MRRPRGSQLGAWVSPQSQIITSRKFLEAKLAERARAQRRAEMDALSGQRSDNAWGSQIRSYVQAPYQLVKDHRSDFETGNVEAVLDGDLDGFMEAELRRQRSAS